MALLLLDVEEGVTAQDAHIAGMLTEEDAGIIVLVNKWDAVEKDTHTLHEMEQKLRHELDFLPYAPIVFISALTGQRVNKILPMVLDVNAARHQRVQMSALNTFMREATTLHPPQKGGIRVKFFYATQAETAPPTFIFFVNKPDWINFSYKRYLENQLQKRWPFVGTPIRLFLRLLTIVFPAKTGPIKIIGSSFML